jgi:hypothetical protein
MATLREFLAFSFAAIPTYVNVTLYARTAHGMETASIRKNNALLLKNNTEVLDWMAKDADPKWRNMIQELVSEGLCIPHDVDGENMVYDFFHPLFDNLVAPSATPATVQDPATQILDDLFGGDFEKVSENYQRVCEEFRLLGELLRTDIILALLTGFLFQQWCFFWVLVATRYVVGTAASPAWQNTSKVALGSLVTWICSQHGAGLVHYFVPTLSMDLATVWHWTHTLCCWSGFWWSVVGPHSEFDLNVFVGVVGMVMGESMKPGMMPDGEMGAFLYAVALAASWWVW